MVSSKGDYHKSPATDKQINKLGDLLNDDRLTYEEQVKLRGALNRDSFLAYSNLIEYSIYMSDCSI